MDIDLGIPDNSNPNHHKACSGDSNDSFLSFEGVRRTHIEIVGTCYTFRRNGTGGRKGKGNYCLISYKGGNLRDRIDKRGGGRVCAKGLRAGICDTCYQVIPKSGYGLWDNLIHNQGPAFYFVLILQILNL